MDGVCQEVGVALGGVAPVPWRVLDVERSLKGKRITESGVLQAAEAALEAADPMSDNEYKVQITKNIVKNAVMSMA